MDATEPPSRRWARRRRVGFNYASTEHAYFVTIRARAGTAPFTDPLLATATLDSLIRTNRGVAIYGLCLMPDHLHLLLRLGSGYGNLGVMIGAFKSFTTRESWKLGYQGQLWQDRFHDHIVRGHEDARVIATYIVENPTRKGLVTEASRYPYSAYPDPL